MYKDIRGFDVQKYEFKEMCGKAWSEKSNHLCFDMTKNKDDGNYRISNESQKNIF